MMWVLLIFSKILPDWELNSHYNTKNVFTRILTKIFSIFNVFEAEFDVDLKDLVLCLSNSTRFGGRRHDKVYQQGTIFQNSCIFSIVLCG